MAKVIKRGERFGRDSSYVATTLSGLEEHLERELRSLRVEETSRGDRAVSFKASQRIFYEVLLRSRLAIRVLRKLHAFSAASREELYRGVHVLPWEQLITPADTFAIRPQSHSSHFKNAKFASQVVKDAIVDRQRGRTGKRSSIDTRRPALQLQLRIRGREVELLLDASPEPLSRRGYRRSGGAAPLNEVLAAGLLDIAGWSGSLPLLDPFCGSGTILAEAAIKSLGLAPNAAPRVWSHLRWPDHRQEEWRRAVEDARGAREGSIGGVPPVVGVDIDAGQLAAARENIRRLGVEELVTLYEEDILKLRPRELALPSDVPATVVTNIPYGGRLGVGEGSDEDIRKLYREFGDWLKQSEGVGEVWVLTGNLSESRSFGLRSSARVELFNGPIECRLLHFKLY